MKLKKVIRYGTLVFCCFMMIFCEKEFLDEKPSSKLVVPNTVEDYTNLLDAYFLLNKGGTLCEISSDDYFLLDFGTWQALPVHIRNAYIWSPDIFEGKIAVPDWNMPYQQVLYANTVLEGLKNIQVSTTSKIDSDKLKGWALFLRAFAFFNLAQTFAPVYDEATSKTDLGIPLKLEADITVVVRRSSVWETYNQILNDLASAKDLLSAEVDISYRNRPSKPAVLALLSRVLLSMRKYDEALINATEAIKFYGNLMDYNSTTTFTRRNDETIYQGEMNSDDILLTIFPNSIIDSILYKSYASNDLRKIRFYKTSPAGNPVRRANYSGTISPFYGLATDELYLIKAESEARSEDIENAMNTLNVLLIKRWATGTFVPFTATNAEQALNIILEERRKELSFRGLRWQDIRRLNKEGRNIPLQRKLNGRVYTLSPNSPLYVLPIPPDELRLSGITQNIR